MKTAEQLVINKKEFSYLQRKLKLLHPKKGDILIVPAEAGFDFQTLSEALKQTPILYALVVPKGNAKLMDKEEAIRFSKGILKKYGHTTNNHNVFAATRNHAFNQWDNFTLCGQNLVNNCNDWFFDDCFHALWVGHKIG